MSTGYGVRIRAPFTVEALRSTAERVLGELVPSVSIRNIEVVETLAQFTAPEGNMPRARPEFLERSLGDSQVLPGGILMTPDEDAVIGLTEIEVGYPEDPEGGRWLFTDLTVDRSAASHLLGIAVAVAAGRLTDSPVVDERGALTGRRLADPEAVVTRLRYDGLPTEHLHDVAFDILGPFGVVGPDQGR